MQNENIKESKINYELLIEQLILVSKEFNACTSFIEDIKKIKDKYSLKRFFQIHIINIGERLSCDFPDEGDIEDLEDQIKDLENEILNLEDTISEYEYSFGIKTNSLSDDYKIKWFLENKHKYTEWELKDLLENGKI